MRDPVHTLAAMIAQPWAISEDVLRAMQQTLALPGALARMGDSGWRDLLEMRAADFPQAAIHKATENAVARKAGAVTVIPVRGTISSQMSVMDYLFGGFSTSPAKVANAVRAAVADDGTKAVVLQIDSPGGSVFEVAEASRAILAARGKKPIVAHVTGQMCSAAYHLGVGADEIVMNPSAMAGSIGVYMLHADWSGYNEQVGLKFTYIHAGKFKVEGNEDAPLDKDAAAHLQQMCDDYYSLFVDDVAKGRGVTGSVVRGEQFGQGRTYIASRAVERGLADKVRTFDETLAAYGVSPGPQATPQRRTAVALAARRYSGDGFV